MSHLRLAVLLGMTVALGPLALDTYLPAFPAIATDLGVEHAAVGVTLSAYLAVFGSVQLIGGPLSDRYGRRPVLLCGLMIFTTGAVLVALAESLAAMIGWRLVQAVGGACCAVSVPAIVRDRVHGSEAARLFSLIGLVMFVAPAAAPSIGSTVLALASWRAIFVLLAVYAAGVGVLLSAALFRHLPPPSGERPPVATLVTNYASVFRCAPAMRFVAIQALVFSAMLVFITHASFIYQKWYGLSNKTFSLLFAANVVGMAGVNLLNRQLLKRHHPAVLLRGAVAVQAAIAVALALLGVYEAPVTAVAPAFIAAIACLGAIAPNNMANTLEFFPRLGGTAAAVLGASQFACAGLVSAASTKLADGTLSPIVLTMAASSLTALALALGAPGAMRRALAGHAEPSAAPAAECE